MDDPTAAFPHEYPCRINTRNRYVHCPSCDMVPELMEQIYRLRSRVMNKQELDALREMILGQHNPNADILRAFLLKE